MGCERRRSVLSLQRLTVLTLFHLPILQFDGCIAPEDVDRHFELASLRFDFLDDAAEVEEGPVVDLHRFPDLETHFRLLVLFGSRNLALDGLDFLSRGRHWRITAYEADHPWGFLDEIPRSFDDTLALIQQHHINKNIARPELAGRNRLLLVPHFHYLLHWHQDLFDVLAHFFRLDALFDALFDLLFLAGEGMDDKPLASHDARV